MAQQYVKQLPLAQVVILGFWYCAPHQGPAQQESTSSSSSAPPPACAHALSPSQINNYNLKKEKKKRNWPTNLQGHSKWYSTIIFRWHLCEHKNKDLYPSKIEKQIFNEMVRTGITL